LTTSGWNSPHPDVVNSPEVVYEHWKKWNSEFAARPAEGFYGFDGIDWDIEGKLSHSCDCEYFVVMYNFIVILCAAPYVEQYTHLLVFCFCLSSGH
jgi:hypothetical protein